MAEQACYRALANVDIGNLGAELKSQKLYNLGRIERKLGKFSKAESILKESLKIEESLPTTSSVKIGRRFVELSIGLAAQDKWAEGAQFLEQVFPIAHQFSDQERSYTSQVLLLYSTNFKDTGRSSLAKRFEDEALALE